MGFFFSKKTRKICTFRFLTGEPVRDGEPVYAVMVPLCPKSTHRGPKSTPKGSSSTTKYPKLIGRSQKSTLRGLKNHCRRPKIDSHKFESDSLIPIIVSQMLKIESKRHKIDFKRPKSTPWGQNLTYKLFWTKFQIFGSYCVLLLR